MVSKEAGTPSTLKMSWRSIAAAEGVLLVSAVATLVIVVAVKGVDALSTVALALAIIAFASQLVIAIAQLQMSNVQTTQAEELHAKNVALLTDIRAATGGIETTVAGQFEYVLRHALGETLRESGGDVAAVVEPEFIPRLQKKVEDLEHALSENAMKKAASEVDIRDQSLVFDPELWNNPDYEELKDELKGKIEIGTVVNHKKWGRGVVTNFGNSEHSIADIDFESVGKKTLYLNIAPIEIVDQPTL